MDDFEKNIVAVTESPNTFYITKSVWGDNAWSVAKTMIEVLATSRYRVTVSDASLVHADGNLGDICIYFEELGNPFQEIIENDQE